MISPSDRKQLEHADVETASEDYAGRFAGEVGGWFLTMQARLLLELLEHLPANASVLDVGGGHAQVTPALIEAGYRVRVVGSHQSCVTRLAPWIANGSCHFEAADLHALPYGDEAFDAVVCLRLLAHSVAWTSLLGELCRTSRYSVVVDYPSTRSHNLISTYFLTLKKRIERNTRPFKSFRPGQVRRAFEQQGFAVRATRPQFLFPMALYRWSKSARLGRIIEAPGRRLGLTRWLGSPVLVRADRIGP